MNFSFKCLKIKTGSGLGLGLSNSCIMPGQRSSRSLLDNSSVLTLNGDDQQAETNDKRGR